jgi:hypothetical protein
MVGAKFVFKIGAACLLACCAAAGCGGRHTGKPLDPASQQLRNIGYAYELATMRLDRPPLRRAELLPFLKKEEDPENPAARADPTDIFRSANDGEEFVIHWGLDVRAVNPAGHPSKVPVLAYEKRGKDGKRFILQHVRIVRKVTDEELAKLPFPPGFKNPVQ